MNTTKKGFPSLSIRTLILILAAAVLVLLIYYDNIATSVGDDIGQETGSLVGRAVGSLEGMTKGREEGTAAGKAAGLSAEDTTADIASELKKVSNLEVLVASVKINDFHSIGEDVEYAALYLLKGDVIFSIDLSQAEIETRNDVLYITLPVPKGELYIDQSQVEKVAEYQRHHFSGSTEDGFDAFLNSMEKVYEASAETLDNYDVLIEAAKTSAVTQVTQLAQSVTVNDRQINVEFREE